MVGTVYPGTVWVRGEQFEPPAAKMATVVLEHVQISDQKARVPTDGSMKWRKMELADLEKLKLYSQGEQKFRFALSGIGISGARPMVSALTPYVAAKALACRVYRMPRLKEWGRGPLPGIWDFAQTFVGELLPDFRCQAMSVPEWLSTMPARRKKPLMRAWERYNRTGWSSGFAKFSSFVKTEFLPGFAKRRGELVRLQSMVDRLIQGPADETHIIAGPYLKPLVKQLKKLWTYDSPIFYGSCGPEALHKFLQESLVDSEHHYFWCDFTMFDNTHSDDSWNFMEQLYYDAGITDIDFWKVMDAWRRPSGRIGPCKYLARVMNASGRDDTALANGVLNGFATYLSACAAWLEKEVLELSILDLRRCSKVIKLSVCGDDSIGSLPPMTEEKANDFARRMAANIALFGFEAKLEHSPSLHKAVYLGMRPYPVNGQWFWGKTIGRAIYKLGWTMLEPGRDVMAHITGVADMHMLCSLHVPILSDMARKIVELRAGAKRTPVVKDENRPWEWTLSGSLPYARDTLGHVAEVYGLTVSDVELAIDNIRSIERLPCVLDCPILRWMIYCDDL